MSKEELPEEYQYKILPEGWWKKVDWLSPDHRESDREPTAFEVMIDYMVYKSVSNPRSVEFSRKLPPRCVLFEIEHPKRGNEYITIMISPSSIKEGIPDKEPDLIIHQKYYDMVRVNLDEIDSDIPRYAGRTHLIGNTTVALDLRDLNDISQGKEPIPRPRAWPVGHP